MPLTNDSIKSEGLLETKSWRTEVDVRDTETGTYTMDTATQLLTIFTGTATGQIVRLPDATQLQLGHRVEIHNNSSQPITVQCNGGTSVATLSSTQRIRCALQAQATACGTWSPEVNELISSQATVHTMFEEFFFAALSDLDIFHFLNFGVNGGSAIIETTEPTDNTYIGKVTCSTGTSLNATGVGGFESSTGGNRIKIGGGELALEFRIRLPVLSGTPQYNVKMGVLNSNTIGTPTNGVYFVYSSTLNSGQWQAITRNASTSTTVNSTVAVVANTWYKLRFQTNSEGTLVSFFVNDVLVGTSSTNIPTTNACRIMFRIEKQGSNSSTSRTLEVDSVYYRMER